MKTQQNTDKTFTLTVSGEELAVLVVALRDATPTICTTARQEMGADMCHRLGSVLRAAGGFVHVPGAGLVPQRVPCSWGCESFADDDSLCPGCLAARKAVR